MNAHTEKFLHSQVTKAAEFGVRRAVKLAQRRMWLEEPEVKIELCCPRKTATSATLPRLLNLTDRCRLSDSLLAVLNHRASAIVLCKGSDVTPAPQVHPTHWELWQYAAFLSFLGVGFFQINKLHQISGEAEGCKKNARTTEKISSGSSQLWTAGSRSSFFHHW